MAAASQTVTEELRRWILAQTEAGCHPNDIVDAMKKSGWQESVAMSALEVTLHARVDELRAQQAPPELDADGLPPATAVPQPALGEAPYVRLSDGHVVRVLTSLKHPRVIVFGNLLSDAECEELIALAVPRLSRSETVDNSTGGSEVNAARTSSGMFFERGEVPLITRIEARFAELLRWPVDHGEGLQILHYRPGAEYRPHNDYFDPAQRGSAAVLRRGGQRVATLVTYLNTPEGGGATTFPDVGLEVAPQRGNAVYFSYDRAHASTKTLHGGAPVTAGEKWVATKWLREGVFT